jgi:hypothetical protein
MKRLALIVLLILCAFGIQASDSTDFPYIGDLHPEVGGMGIGLRYDCNKAGDTLKCHFTQVFVRQKLSREDAAKRNTQFEQEYAEIEGTEKGDELMAKLCGDGEGSTTAEQYRKGISDREKEMARDNLTADADYKEMLSLMRQLMKSCDDKKQFLKIFKQVSLIAAQIDTHTCNVSLNQYEKEFYFNPDTQQWTYSQQPSGVCGMVIIGTWENDTLNLWDYTERRTVTNRKGNDGLLDCDQREDLNVKWTWKSIEKGVTFECKRFVLSAY